MISQASLASDRIVAYCGLYIQKEKSLLEVFGAALRCLYFYVCARDIFTTYVDKLKKAKKGEFQTAIKQPKHI